MTRVINPFSDTVTADDDLPDPPLADEGSSSSSDKFTRERQQARGGVDREQQQLDEDVAAAAAAVKYLQGLQSASADASPSPTSETMKPGTPPSYKRYVFDMSV